MSDLERLKIDIAPVYLRILSEPYVRFLASNYVPVVDVQEIKTKRKYFLVISAKSISLSLRKFQEENEGTLISSEFWIHKESNERTAKYLISES